MNESREVVNPPPDSGQDALLYRIIVIALSLALLLTIAGGLVLAAMKIPIPGELIGLGGMAGGALGGLLAPSPIR